MVVYCDTIKGKGVSFMEGKNKYHSVKNYHQLNTTRHEGIR